MAITAGGIGSGLDIGSLVAQLVAAEGQPALFRLDTKEARLQADLSAIGTLNSALSQFQDTVTELNDPDTFLKRTTGSSDSAVFTATSDKTAVVGSYDIEVVQLASSTKVRSGDFASATDVVGTGMLDITLGAETFQITVDATNQTLAGIRDAINNASNNPGVTASIINVDGGGGSVSRLILSSEKEGASNTITIVTADDDLNNTDVIGLSQLASVNLTTVQTAQDAIIKVDQQQVTRDSNSFSDVISGVTINLKDSNVGSTEKLTIALNTANVEIKINSFIEAYNSLADTMKVLGAYNAETGVAGGLQGDSSLRSVQNQLRDILTSSVAGLDFGTLAEIGVVTDENGHLKVDDDKLDSVLSSNFEAISQIFASEDGLANSLDTLLERYISSDGTLSSRTESIKSRIDSISDDRARLDKRLIALEKRYSAQFIAMDIAVGQLQGLGSFLSQQLASLPKPNSIGN